MNCYYVYILFRPDGRPCYVGKGKGYRFAWHEKYTHNVHLARIIANARKQGKRIKAVKVRENMSEKAAFALEKRMIKKIGRRDQGKGPLVNFTDGGEGVSNLPAETLAAMRKRLAKQNRTQKQKDAVIASTNRILATPEGRRAFAARLGNGSAGPITETRREAIRAAVSEYWRRYHENGDTSRSGKRTPEQCENIRRAISDFHERRRREGRPVKNSKARLLIIDGITLNLADACRMKDIPHERVRARIKRGMDPLEALAKG